MLLKMVKVRVNKSLAVSLPLHFGNQPYMAPITEAPVLVTGATGFVGHHIVQLLLKSGYHVRGTVRSLKSEGAAVIQAMGEAHDNRLTLVEANLLDEASLIAACEGCEYVMHVASPVTTKYKDPEKDLVTPALTGCKGILAGVLKHGVKRLVLTSSESAMHGGAVPVVDPLNEESWDTESNLKNYPYNYSKRLAEQEAWKVKKESGDKFELAVINPFIVQGSTLLPTKHAEGSLSLPYECMMGILPVIAKMHVGLVHAEDVALAHVRAMETPEANGRRFIVVDDQSPILLETFVAKLRERFPLYSKKLPTWKMTGTVGNALVKLISYTQPKGIGEFIREAMHPIPADNTPAKDVLKMTFRPGIEGTFDGIESLIAAGMLDKAKVKK